MVSGVDVLVRSGTDVVVVVMSSGVDVMVVEVR